MFGDWAVRIGWLARARAILTEAGEDSPEHGWVLIIRAFLEPDAQAREAFLREAIAIGRRFGDPDIEFYALSYLGGVLVMTDRVEEGLVLTDEALAAACAGELAEVATVDSIFCGFFWTCELVTTSLGPTNGCAPRRSSCSAGTSLPPSAAPTTAES